MLKKEEGKINFLQKFRLAQHLALCRFCRLFQQQNQIINQSLSNAETESDAKLSNDEKEAIVQKLS